MALLPTPQALGLAQVAAFSCFWQDSEKRPSQRPIRDYDHLAALESPFDADAA